MKKIVVTGGSAGIGRGITEHLLQNNFEVWFTYHQSEVAKQEILTNFPNAKAIQVDFTNSQSLSNFLNEIDTIQPDALINNFYNGTFIGTYFHKTEAEQFLKEYKDNILPTIEVTQRCIAHFRKKKQGSIVTLLTSSLDAPAIGTSVYNANKAYLQQLTKHWAIENIKFGITSNSISPTFVATDFHKNLDERVMDSILSSYPIKETLSTEDIAKAVLYCIEAGKHFNGNNLFLDVNHR